MWEHPAVGPGRRARLHKPTTPFFLSVQTCAGLTSSSPSSAKLVTTQRSRVVGERPILELDVLAGRRRRADHRVVRHATPQPRHRQMHRNTGDGLPAKARSRDLQPRDGLAPVTIEQRAGFKRRTVGRTNRKAEIGRWVEWMQGRGELPADVDLVPPGGRVVSDGATDATLHAWAALRIIGGAQ